MTYEEKKLLWEVKEVLRDDSILHKEDRIEDIIYKAMDLAKNRVYAQIQIQRDIEKRDRELGEMYPRL